MKNNKVIKYLKRRQAFLFKVILVKTQHKNFNKLLSNKKRCMILYQIIIFSI